MANINLTPIFQAIIGLLAALITYRLIPWIKSKTTNEQKAALRALVKTLVFAAEQIYGEGHGHEKLNYVQQKLAQAGYIIDVSEIEAAVGEYINNIPGVVYAQVQMPEEPPDIVDTLVDDGK